MFTLRAERDTDTDFARPLRDGISHHAVEAERGEQNGDGRKSGKQHRVKAARRDRIVEERFERRDVAQRLVLVDLLDLVFDRGHETGGGSPAFFEPGPPAPKNRRQKIFPFYPPPPKFSTPPPP